VFTRASVALRVAGADAARVDDDVGTCGEPDGVPPTRRLVDELPLTS
jgi:hypothetical protein